MTGTARFAVVGGGAVGALFAAAAQAAGVPVTLCVRTPIRALQVATGGSWRTVPAEIATDPASQDPTDWVVVATKVQDTAGAAPWLERLVGPASVVVAAQNGIEPEQRIRPLVDAATPVIQALVYAAVERIEAGRIVHHRGRRVVVPAGPQGAALARLLAGNGLIEVEQVDDFTTESWRKLLGNVAANPITALTMRRVDVLAEPAIRDLARGLLLEAAAAGRAAGAKLSDADVEHTLSRMTGFGTASGTSMLYDRLRGAPLEHQYLNGAVVRTADAHGVAAPLNRAVLTLLDALDCGIREAARGNAG